MDKKAGSPDLRKRLSWVGFSFFVLGVLFAIGGFLVMALVKENDWVRLLKGNYGACLGIIFSLGILAFFAAIYMDLAKKK